VEPSITYRAPRPAAGQSSRGRSRQISRFCEKLQSTLNCVRSDSIQPSFRRSSNLMPVLRQSIVFNACSSGEYKPHIRSMSARYSSNVQSVLSKSRCRSTERWRACVACFRRARMPGARPSIPEVAELCTARHSRSFLLGGDTSGMVQSATIVVNAGCYPTAVGKPGVSHPVSGCFVDGTRPTGRSRGMHSIFYCLHGRLSRMGLSFGHGFN